MRNELTAAFVSFKHIVLSDVAEPAPRSAYYAYSPATGIYWALASFEPSSTAPPLVSVNFQDGGGTGMFCRAGTGAWQVELAHAPPIYLEVHFFPGSVLAAWGLSTAPPPTAPAPTG